MKSVRFIAAIAILSTVTLTSCKKYYTCTCTTTEAGNSATTKFEKQLRAKAKNDATEQCATFQNQYNSTNTGSTKCTI